jgi:hypothetical protein
MVAAAMWMRLAINDQADRHTAMRRENFAGI